LSGGGPVVAGWWGQMETGPAVGVSGRLAAVALPVSVPRLALPCCTIVIEMQLALHVDRSPSRDARRYLEEQLVN